MKPRYFLFGFMVLTLGLVGSLSASARSLYAIEDVAIDIIDDSGRTLRQYPSRSERGGNTIRTFIEAAGDENYVIRAHNRSPHRVGLVIAVDGRNIISGKKSYLDRNERKYVLDPHESAVYDGWRTARNRINRFYFTDPEDSYADAFDDRSAMGVIAVAVYREKSRFPQPLTAQPKRKRFSSDIRSSRDDSEAGTGFGEEEWSPSRTVRFEPQREPIARYFVKYEWRETLCRKGILSCGRHQSKNRFWPDEWDDNDGFAPYPPRDRHAHAMYLLYKRGIDE
jgi:hypothetical protein